MPDPQPEHLLFLTGHLAERSLRRQLESMEPNPFRWSVRDMGVNVAALMTTDLIERRLTDLGGADRVVIPGRCRGDIARLAGKLGVPVSRGPEELIDLPRFFGRKAKVRDLSRYETQIFAEIVEAPQLDIAAIASRAQALRDQGADVIDLGCLPATPFPHLEDAVRHLKATGFTVSVDSLDTEELLRGGRAGADYLLSLREDTLWIADEVASTPILIPGEGDRLDSLERAMAVLDGKGRRYLADPILDPIHFGFTESIHRFRELRRRHPEVPIMMGIGNITELTHADTLGMNALLFGIVSELHIEAVLAVQVSEHARSVIREADRARRVMFAAREDGALPKDFSADLFALHERKPFPLGSDDIADLAASVKDGNFRIVVAEDGVHVFNRDGHHVAEDAFSFWPKLGVEDDAAHAFYLGAELARAEIAWQLGKRYAQDEPLRWGPAVAPASENLLEQKTAGPTLTHRRHGRSHGSKS